MKISQIKRNKRCRKNNVIEWREKEREAKNVLVISGRHL